MGDSRLTLEAGDSQECVTGLQDQTEEDRSQCRQRLVLGERRWEVGSQPSAAHLLITWQVESLWSELQPRSQAPPISPLTPTHCSAWNVRALLLPGSTHTG